MKLKSILLTTTFFNVFSTAILHTTPLLAADKMDVMLTSPSDGEVMVQQNVPEQLTLAEKTAIFARVQTALSPHRIILNRNEVVNLSQLYLPDKLADRTQDIQQIIWTEICQMPWLRTLILLENQLTVIPPTIGALTALKCLDLSSNQLTEIPPTIGALVQLEELSLFNNQLTKLPSEIGALAQLRRLSLSGNQLTTIPACVANIKTLSWINLQENLSLLPRGETPDQWGYEELRQHFGHSCHMTNPIDVMLTSTPPSDGEVMVQQNVPEQLTLAEKTAIFARVQTALSPHGIVLNHDHVVNLSKLYLRAKLAGHTQDTQQIIWTEISQMPWLTRLILPENQLTEIPPTIGALTALKCLDLSSNQLTEIPPTIGALVQLEELDLFENQLTTIPARVANIKTLSWISLQKNLSLLPKGETPDQWGYEELRQHFGHSCHMTNPIDVMLTSTPPSDGEVMVQQNVPEQLTLAEKTAIFARVQTALSPHGIVLDHDQVVNLSQLYLPAKLAGRTQDIQQIIWTEICQMPWLTRLILPENQLTAIPPTIGALTALKCLDLSSNQLTEIPPTIGALVQLEEFNLSSNQLTTIPARVANIKTLSYINLQENLSLLPKGETPDQWGYEELRQHFGRSFDMTNPTVEGIPNITARTHFYRESNEKFMRSQKKLNLQRIGLEKEKIVREVYENFLRYEKGSHRKISPHLTWEEFHKLIMNERLNDKQEIKQRLRAYFKDTYL